MTENIVAPQKSADLDLLCFQSKIFSRTSLARTLMAHSHGLARTIVMVPKGHFVHNPPWMA